MVARLVDATTHATRRRRLTCGFRIEDFCTLGATDDWPVSRYNWPAARDAVAKLDLQFGYADGYDQAAGRYQNLIWAKNPPELMPSTAVLVRAVEALGQLERDVPVTGSPAGSGGATSPTTSRRWCGDAKTPTWSQQSASTLWVSRNRHGPPDKVVRCDPERGRRGASTHPRCKGEDDPRHSGLGAGRLCRKRSGRGSR